MKRELDDLRFEKTCKTRHTSNSYDKYKGQERTRHSKWIFYSTLYFPFLHQNYILFNNHLVLGTPTDLKTGCYLLFKTWVIFAFFLPVILGAVEVKFVWEFMNDFCFCGGYEHVWLTFCWFGIVLFGWAGDVLFHILA